VEIDETFIGRKGKVVGGGTAHKHAVLTLVSRQGEARSFHIDRANVENILPIIRENLAQGAKVVTDDASYYRNLDK
jgi:transposase-like protein